MFITLEGGEGCGKSTQAALLKDYLESLGKKVVITREPGGTHLAENIRNLILANEGIADTMTEFLLLTTARRDHVLNVINPALLLNEVVICDRFVDSTLVYQGYIKGLSFNTILELTKLSIGDLTPTLTILLDISPELGLKRILQGNRNNNHYDKKGLEFHIKTREGYLEIAQKFPSRIKVVDGSESQNIVFSKVKALIDQLL